MSAFGGKADIEQSGGCYPSCRKRCFSGDRGDCLFTTVRFAHAEAFLTIRAAQNRANVRRRRHCNIRKTAPSLICWSPDTDH